MLPIAQVHRSPLLPDTVLLTAPGAFDLTRLLPPVPLVAAAPADTLRWKFRPEPIVAIRTIDVTRLFHSVRTSRSHDRIWAEDWWHSGERRGWWED